MSTQCEPQASENVQHSSNVGESDAMQDESSPKDGWIFEEDSCYVDPAVGFAAE